MIQAGIIMQQELEDKGWCCRRKMKKALKGNYEDKGDYKASRYLLYSIALILSIRLGLHCP